MAAPPVASSAVSANLPPSSSPPRRDAGAWPWLLLLLALAAAGFWGWQQWQGRQARDRAANADAALRLDALEARLDGLRGDQRTQAQRLQQADSTNRVLRDELLGIGQRAALLEDSVSKLADPDRHGAQALRLDETELLLTMGQQRLRVSGDLDGARRAYALAAGVLDGIDDPAYLSLRQTLLQERAGLDALGADPKVRALAALDAFVATLASAPPRAANGQRRTQPWWRRAFGSLVQVQPATDAIAVQPSERAVAQVGLELEFALARVAAERRDHASYHAALQRAQVWLARLWPASDALRQRRTQLQALAAMPLSLSLPTLGTTLQQLRQMRASR